MLCKPLGGLLGYGVQRAGFVKQMRRTSDDAQGLGAGQLCTGLVVEGEHIFIAAEALLPLVTPTALSPAVREG